MYKHIYLWHRRQELARFLRQTRNGRQVQLRTLLKKIRRNADSDFGRAHGFSKIRSVADYQRRVPVTTYDDYLDYIERLKRGQTHAMFRRGTKLLMFAMTSGATDKAKYIPVTAESFAEYRRGWRLWMAGLVADHSYMMNRRVLKLGSNWRQFDTDGGVPCGNISGRVTEASPYLVQLHMALPKAVGKISDPFSKHYISLRIAIGLRNVGLIATANPSTLIEMARLADAHREALVRDIFDGTISDEVELPGAIRVKLQRFLGRRDQDRARELEAIIEKTGKLYPRHFWLQLGLLCVWTGGSVGAYLSQLKTYYGEKALRDHGLSSSEGRMTIPMSDGTCEGLLEYDHHFFEFIPVEEYDSESPTALLAHELKAGADYYILLTTSGGLCRYDIHDVVRCVGFEGEVPILKFLNKGKHFSSVTGENLSEYQVVSAVRNAHAELRLQIDSFTLAPTRGERPGYILIVEPSNRRGLDHELCRRIDGHLSAMNLEYAGRLQTNRLSPLRIVEVPSGTWRELRRQKSAARGNFEEYKRPFLTSDMGHLDRLLGMMPSTDKAA